MALLVPWFVLICVFRIRGNTWPWAVVKGSAWYAVGFAALALAIGLWG